MEKEQENQPDSIMEDDQDSDGAETVAPPDVSTNKPLRVKIKFPNMKKSVEEDGPKVKNHFCLECKKRFSSGKALGGHMSSAHVQANKDFSLKKMKSKTKRRPKKLVCSGSPSGYGGKNICKICEKEFTTKKSLFGHMRSHPDREWRGMEPPAEAVRNLSEPEFEAVNEVPSHVLDGDQVDSGLVVVSAVLGLNESVKWQVTGKRGWSPTKPVIDSPPLQSSKEILAVQQLIRLVNGDSKPSEDLDSKVNEGEATSSNFWTPEDVTDDANQDFQLDKNREKVFPAGDERYSPVKKLKIWERTDENPGGAQSRRTLCNFKGKGKLIPGYDTENSTSSDSSSDEFDYPYKYHPRSCMMTKIKNTKEKISMELESAPNFSHIGLAAESAPPAVTPDKYICITCRKSFLKPQALGGRRSSHKKFKVKVYNTIDDKSSNGASYVKNVPKANAIKQLEVNKALGVQNQCHCTGECNHAYHVTSADKAKKEKRVHEFDLNEPGW
ncbi:unnamed protein product [Fraxinus pennsylvanica]|uniref:C2H2-type domain-containing protein n=1 Tax=Fraxinus pennsylvanica TaxID=56036 RepID=A0AAD2ADS0_9LAMI|nr:unnamed protein product [Fraxinus pennsylvanica]